MAQAAPVPTIRRPSLPDGSIGLFYYLLAATGMAFFNRTMPTPFLPLVLTREFRLRMGVVGFVLAAYPLGALAATSWSCSVARSTRGIVRLHSVTILAMACAALLFAVCVRLLGTDAAVVLGPSLSALAIAALRAVQGASQALYLASNTSLITRRFHEAVPYVIGMAEVAVGFGAQCGRLCGGLLYDAGGLACPFCAVAMLQSLCGAVGFAFPDDPSAPVLSSSEPVKAQVHDLPCSMLVTARVGVALAGVLVSYFMTGLYDATLPQYLEGHLGPLSVTAVSLVSSLRNISYLIVSYCCAQLLHRDAVSFERLIAVGAGFVVIGLILVAPVPFVEEMVPHLLPSVFGRWCIEVVALTLSSAGNAMLFVPSLPLMQTEVRHLGTHAEEQVAILFMSAMSVGEATGPILGGWLVEAYGFVLTTGSFAALILPLLVCALATFDAEVARQRQRLKMQAEEEALVRPGFNCDRVTSPTSAFCVPVDGEGAYMYRRIPFALNEAQAVPSSAPSASFRRQYSPACTQPRMCATGPATSWRRPYRVSPPGGPSAWPPLQTSGSRTLEDSLRRATKG